MAASTRLNHIGWEIDSTNRVFFTQDGSDLILGYTINGTNTCRGKSMLDKLFVDTLFVIALINNRDQYHQQVLEASERFEGYPLLITDAG